jgi:O-antigen ligase
MTNDYEKNHLEYSLLKSLFYIFPLIMLGRSGLITTYVTILTIYTIYFFYKNKIKIKIFLIDYFIFLVFFLLIVSTIINLDKLGYFILLKSITYIRFGLFFLIIRNLFYYKFLNFKPIIILTTISCIFLSFDIFIQHIYGQDLFGYKPWHNRYAGIFDDEAIAGSYIQKFAFLCIPTILLFKKLNILKKILITLIITTLGLGILMSTDRMPFIMYLVGITVLIIVTKKFKFLYLLSLFLILCSFVIIYKNNNIIQKRYSFLNSFIIPLNKNNNELSTKSIPMLNDDYFKIFYSSYEIWKKNPIIGNGAKSYSISCFDQSFEDKKKKFCAPHAHNIYFEILTSIGIIGFSFFVINIFILLIKFKKKLIQNNNIYLYLFIILFCELFPFRSYGSIFHTVNGTMFWYLFGLISTVSFTKKNKNYF